MFANMPWTLFVTAPINNALIAICADAAGPASRALIEQWGVVSRGRTAISFVAVGVFMWPIVRAGDLKKSYSL